MAWTPFNVLPNGNGFISFGWVLFPGGWRERPLQSLMSQAPHSGTIAHQQSSNQNRMYAGWTEHYQAPTHFCLKSLRRRPPLQCAVSFPLSTSHLLPTQNSRLEATCDTTSRFKPEVSALMNKTGLLQSALKVKNYSLATIELICPLMVNCLIKIRYGW